MKSLLTLLEEIIDEVIDTDKKILDMWASNLEVEDIVKATKKKVSYIKNVLKKNSRKGWESL